MRTKVLAIGDLHFQSHNTLATDAFTRYLSETIRSNIESIDAVVVLGDVLHRHDRVDLFPLHRAVKFFKEIHSALAESNRGIPLWIIIGNHDRPNNATFLTDEHPFTALCGWSNTVIADSPTIVTAPSSIIEDSPKEYHKFLLMPYVFPGRFHEALGWDPKDPAAKNDAWWNNPELLGSEKGSKIAGVFAHQEFRGCPLAGGMVSKWGDVYPEDAPYCVSGHIHKKCKLGNNIFYVGAPLQSGSSIAHVSLLTYHPFQKIPQEDVWKIFPIPADAIAKYSSKQEFIKVASSPTVDVSELLSKGGVSNLSGSNAKVIVHSDLRLSDIEPTRREVMETPGAQILTSLGIPLIIKGDRNDMMTHHHNVISLNMIKKTPFAEFMQNYANSSSEEVSKFLIDLFSDILS